MISKQGLDRAVNSAIANGSINTSINGDTVTLYGVVDGSYEANKARHAALNIDGVNKVINRLTANR